MQSFPGEEAAFFHASGSWSESEGSPIWASCGAIAHAGVTELSGTAGAGRRWWGVGDRLAGQGPNGSGLSRGAPFVSGMRPPPRPFLLCPLPSPTSPGSRSARAPG